MNKTTKDIITYSIFIIVCILSLSHISLYKHRIDELEHQLNNSYDTAYNHIVIDSIRYNIIQKDSIIVNYKHTIAYEIQQNIASTDSDAVKLFYSLLSE